MSLMLKRILGWVAGYILGVLIGLDVLLNAILAGQPYNTISCRVGLSIQNGGWASHIPWIFFFIDKWSSEIYTTVV